MAFLLIVALLAASAAGAAAAEDLCPGSKLTQAEREQMLKVHNDFRSRIALGQMTVGGNHLPPAANMMKMEWDCELENGAQKWAESTNCVKIHAEEGLGQKPKNQGENIGINWGKRIDAATDALKRMIDEYANFTSTVFTIDAKRAGHATQMAWAKSRKLGCGMEHENCPLDGVGAFAGRPQFLVCRYAPEGNILVPNEAPRDIYTVGDACSQCPNLSSCEAETGLCVRNETAVITSPAPPSTTAGPSTTFVPATWTQTACSDDAYEVETAQLIIACFKDDKGILRRKATYCIHSDGSRLKVGESKKDMENTAEGMCGTIHECVSNSNSNGLTAIIKDRHSCEKDESE